MQFDFSGFKPPPGSRIGAKTIKFGLIVLVLVIIVAGSFYQVGAEEMGVILRLGKYVRSTNPGLHLKLPLGIERVMKVPVERQLKLEFGFRTIRPAIRSEYVQTANTEEEARMLTGDLNVVDVEWIIQYKIRDAYDFLFKIRNPTDTFRAMSEASVRRVVGDSSVDEVITIGRTRIAEEAKQLLQQLCDAYEIGIEVNQLIFQDVNPPDEVKPSFNEVNEALQEKERKINDAWAEYNQEIPKASGEAEQMIRAAEGYAAQRVNNAHGDAARFVSIYREYAKAPVVTKKRLYLEAMTETLAALERKIIIDKDLKNVLPLFNLAEEVKK